MDLIVDRRGPVQIITLNRPASRNALTAEMSRGIATALDELDADDSLAVGVFTGAGGTFCSGRDLKAAISGEHPWVEGRGFAGMTQFCAAKPVIAAIEGYAVGGGFEMALACDLIVAAENATISLPEATRGRIPGAGGLTRLPRKVPQAIAMQMALTGRPMPVSRLYDLGLVNEVSAPGAALELALSIAEVIAANAPLAVRTSKRVIVESADWSESEQFERLEPFAAALRSSQDAKEGAIAFAEKRPPVWQGR